MDRRHLSIVALFGVLSGGAGLSVAVARSGPAAVTIHVPGARNISVYCGGDQTIHADGDEVTLEPTTPHCVLVAPWTAVMPLRGELAVGNRSRVECLRSNLTLRCE